jgi:hypothetical protein
MVKDGAGFTKPLSNGETVWLYQIWTNTGGDLNGPGTSYCDQYSLRFDRHATLREWKHPAEACSIGLSHEHS